MGQSLRALTGRDAIALGVEASTPEEVIRLLATRLERAGRVRPSFAEAVLAREAAMPTGLPMGYAMNVAVPHTDAEHVRQPAIAIATLARPVDFANMENPGEVVAVGLVFMLALNDKDHQIEMLQQIMEIVQDAGTVEALIAAGTTSEVFALLERNDKGAGETP